MLITLLLVSRLQLANGTIFVFQITSYNNCIDMLHQFRFASQMTDDKIARTIYHALCLEVAMAGGKVFALDGKIDVTLSTTLRL